MAKYIEASSQVLKNYSCITTETNKQKEKQNIKIRVILSKTITKRVLLREKTENSDFQVRSLVPLDLPQFEDIPQLEDP